MKSLSCVLSLFFVAALVAPISTFAQQKKSNAKEVSLFDADDFMKMKDADKAQYLEALREYYEKNQANDPAGASSFTQYFLNEVWGGMIPAAEAVDAGVPVVGSIVGTSCMGTDGVLKNTNECISLFRDKLHNGEFGSCQEFVQNKTNGAEMSLTCRQYNKSDTTTYTIPTRRTRGSLSLGGDERGPWNSAREAGNTSSMNHEMSQRSATDVPLAVNNPANSNPPGAAPAAGGGPATPEPRVEGARCFYAGFMIAKPATGRGACTPVSDLCANNHQVRMGGGAKGEGGPLKSLVGCGTDAAKDLTCDSSSTSAAGATAGATQAATTTSTVRANSGGKGKIACNPLLYGLKDGGKKPVCVNRGKNASSDCGTASSLEDTLKWLKALSNEKKAQFKVAFNQMMDQLKVNCKPYWKLGENAVFSEAVNDQDSNLKVNNKADYKQTCQVLLNRAIAVGEGSGDTELKAKAAEMIRGTAPAGPSINAPAPATGGTK